MPSEPAELQSEPSRLSEAMLAELAQSAPVRAYPKNTILISEGDTGDTLFIIVAGRLKVFLTNDEGKEIVLSEHGPGEYLGEMSLDGRPRSASVMTMEPCKLMLVGGEQLKGFLAQHPDFNWHLILKLIDTVRRSTESIKSLALEDVYHRVVKLLTQMGHEEDGKLVIDDRPTHQDIANRVGASRDMVTRIFGELTKGGYIALDGRKLVVTKKLPARW